MPGQMAAVHAHTDDANGALFVLLAGGMRPSPLQQALGIHPLCLPFTGNDTLLDRWLSKAQALESFCVVIAVSSHEDSSQIQSALASSRFAHADSMQIRVVMESETWRGPAGLLRDLAFTCWCDFGKEQYGPAGVVLAGEASCLPLHENEPIVQRLGDDRSGISVISSSGEPAGLYAFTNESLTLVPPVGYFDIKEQLLPALYARGTPVQEMRIVGEPCRVRDRESYLRAIRQLVTREGPGNGCSDGALINASARVAGRCLIEHGATIGPEAIVHESIVMEGAVVGRGAVVSHSVVGPSCRVQQGQIVKRAVIGPGRKAGVGVAALRALSGILRLGGK